MRGYVLGKNQYTLEWDMRAYEEHCAMSTLIQRYLLSTTVGNVRGTHCLLTLSLIVWRGEATLTREGKQLYTSTYSSSDYRKWTKGFKFNSSRATVRWDTEDWNIYEHAILNSFEESLLSDIARGNTIEVKEWDKKKTSHEQDFDPEFTIYKACKASSVQGEGHGNVKWKCINLRRE